MMLLLLALPTQSTLLILRKKIYNDQLNEVTYIPQPCGYGIAVSPYIQYLEEKDKKEAEMLIGDQSGPLLEKKTSQKTQ